MPETIYLSHHAANRLMERGISEQHVLDTVRLGNMIADNGEKTLYARGRMRVVLFGNELVITAYRQKKRNPKRSIQKRRRQLRQYARGTR